MTHNTGIARILEMGGGGGGGGGGGKNSSNNARVKFWKRKSRPLIKSRVRGLLIGPLLGSHA